MNYPFSFKGSKKHVKCLLTECPRQGLPVLPAWISPPLTIFNHPFGESSFHKRMRLRRRPHKWSSASELLMSIKLEIHRFPFSRFLGSAPSTGHGQEQIFTTSKCTPQRISLTCSPTFCGVSVVRNTPIFQIKTSDSKLERKRLHEIHKGAFGRNFS